MFVPLFLWMSTPEKPFLFVEVVSGWGLPTEDVLERFELAAFPSGKVIWSHDGKKYFLANIGRPKAAEAISRIKKAGAFSVKFWHYAAPDASGVTIDILDGKQRFYYSVSDMFLPLPNDPPYGRSPDEWRDGTSRWRMLRALQKELTPKLGKPITRPSQDKQHLWLGL